MSNRFSELENTLVRRPARQSTTAPKKAAKTAHPRRAPLTPPGAAPVAQGLSAKVSSWSRSSAQSYSPRAFEAVNYSVPGNFWVLAQPSGMACWATVFTMLKSWRVQQQKNIEQALATVGQRWVDIYKADTGLLGDDKPEFLAAAGLHPQPPQSYSVQGWENLLRNYGPIWVTTDEDPGQRAAIHARIITGIHGDGTPENTKFKIVDPAGGRRYEESIAVFVPKYEEEVRRTGYMRVQVVHWRADAVSEQRSLAHSYRSRASASDAPVARSLALGRALSTAPDFTAKLQELRTQGVPEAEIQAFLGQLNLTRAQAYPGAMSGGRTEVHLPGGYSLSGWKGELLVAAIMAGLASVPVAGTALAALIPLLRAAANRYNVTIGLGPAVTGGVAVGAGFGYGIMFAPGNQVGFYGTLSGVVGAIVSISATMQVTIIHGGPSLFSGAAVAVGMTAGVDAPVGPTGGVHALMSGGRFIGVTFELGVSAGLSPIEAYAQFQYTATSMALARQAYAFAEEIPLSPANGGQSIDASALRIGDILLSRASGVVSRAIRTVSDAPVSHASVYIGGGQVVEALANGVVLNQLEDSVGSNEVVVAFRYPNLTSEQELRIRDFVGQHLGTGYNYWGIVRQAPFSVDRRICERLPDGMRQRCTSGMARIFLGRGDTDRFFCSQLVVAAYQHAGVPLTSADPRWVSPGDLARMREDAVPAFTITHPLQYVGHLKA